MNLVEKYLGEEREGKYFKKGDTVVWKAPDGTKMQGTVVTGDIRGKLKVMPVKGKQEVLVQTNKAKKK